MKRLPHLARQAVSKLAEKDCGDHEPGQHRGKQEATKSFMTKLQTGFRLAAVSAGDLKHTATPKVMIVPHMIHHGNSRTGIQPGRANPVPPNMLATPLSRPLR